ncbi:hypothetical protein [uncultured Thiodictyon sp.]|jgi:hypothetical protein|uniref:hypothetical protein n=1 Tax=uncultured Thiodictyon sp. TaxID=1846217 RepID=UPI0025E0ABE5|nr:hypothetical protein [uncultured Thiodictyon sp.]
MIKLDIKFAFVLFLATSCGILNAQQHPEPIKVSPPDTHLRSKNENTSSYQEPKVPKESTPKLPTKAEAIRLIEMLEKRIGNSDSILRKGDFKALHDHSVALNQIKEKAENMFGDSVFEPLGYCFGAAMMGRSFWQEKLFNKSKSDAISLQLIDSARKRYIDNLELCKAQITEKLR